MHVPTRHQLDELAARRTGELASVYELAVTQHRVAIGDALDFFQKVRHVKDGHAALGQLAHDTEQALGLARIQRAGRLIQNQNPTLCLGQGARQTQQLTITLTEISRTLRELRLLAHLVAIPEPAPLPLAA